MPARWIGAHMPTSGGLHKAVREGSKIGCTAVQVFTNSPQQWAAKAITCDAVSALALALEETGIERRHLVSHDSYLINLCAPDLEKREQSRQGMIREILRCNELGIPWVVSHVGAHMSQGEEAGMKAAAESLLQVLDETPDFVTVLMETTAGQGSSLNYRFDQMATMFELLGNHPRVGVCLDTCHIFAAGYDIRTPGAYAATFAEWDRLVGRDKIKVLHVNDSKKALGTRVDRHNHLGEGEIGESAFRCLVHDPLFEETPMVVETPDAVPMHQANVAKLWQWASEASPL